MSTATICSIEKRLRLTTRLLEPVDAGLSVPKNYRSEWSESVNADQLRDAYPNSRIRIAGPRVVIRFDDGVRFEILPAFPVQDDGYTFADSTRLGAWRTGKPQQEIHAFSSCNEDCNGNLVELGRMARAWKDRNKVPISGLLIDTLAYQFLRDWAHRDKGHEYYNRLTRDFFAYLAAQEADKTHWTAPGSGSQVPDGGFQSLARQAEHRSRDAIHSHDTHYDYPAKQSYRDIYGVDFPA